MNLWRVEVDEASGNVLGPPETLTAGGAGFRGPMSLSADGRRVAYTERTDTSNIERIRFDREKEAGAGPPEPVTRGSLQVMYMDLSPDGEWLVFNSGGKQEDLYVIGTDGSARRQLTDDPAKDRGPRCSPDGRRIAFYSARGGKYDIWVVGADGTGLRQITSTTRSGAMPAWSPDGTRLSLMSAAASYIVDLSKQETAAVPEEIPAQSEAGGSAAGILEVKRELERGAASVRRNPLHHSGFNAGICNLSHGAGEVVESRGSSRKQIVEVLNDVGKPQRRRFRRPGIQRAGKAEDPGAQSYRHPRGHRPAPRVERVPPRPASDGRKSPYAGQGSIQRSNQARFRRMISRSRSGS
jgi:hypothetical protein